MLPLLAASEPGSNTPSAGGESGADVDMSLGAVAASGAGVTGSGAVEGATSAGLLVCSDPGVFFALGMAVAVFPFLFLMRIFPMSSDGLGMG